MPHGGTKDFLNIPHSKKGLHFSTFCDIIHIGIKKQSLGEKMKHINILYNPKAGNGWNEAKQQAAAEAFPSTKADFFDMTKTDLGSFLKSMTDETDALAIVGGDGTINRFVNDAKGIQINVPIYYLAGGSGNDFLHDIGGESGKPIRIDGYIKDLPEVTVNGKTSSFINGIGYGIDGYCCEVGDAQKLSGKTEINYAGIAIKGLLFHFHPSNAVVMVDGVRHTFKKVWLAPTMFGRYYGGGMMPTPAQDRNKKERQLSVLVWHGSGKLSTLAAFPSIFKGKHIKHEKMCEILTGKEISVEFDSPCALQIDGETVLNVSGYTASVKVTVPVTAE